MISIIVCIACFVLGIVVASCGWAIYLMSIVERLQGTVGKLQKISNDLDHSEHQHLTTGDDGQWYWKCCQECEDPKTEAYIL
jgi:hypothetical protein